LAKALSLETKSFYTNHGSAKRDILSHCQFTQTINGTSDHPHSDRRRI